MPFWALFFDSWIMQVRGINALPSEERERKLDDLAFDYGPLLPAEEKERTRQREMDGREL